MEANRTILNMKYARIISEIAKIKNIDNLAAMDIFYTSPLFPLIENGVADLHCRSDRYLAIEIIDGR